MNSLYSETYLYITSKIHKQTLKVPKFSYDYYYSNIILVYRFGFYYDEF